MSSLFRKYAVSRDYPVLMLLLVVALGLIFLANDQTQNGPAQRVAVDLMGRLAVPLGTLVELRHLKSENEDLRLENARLRLEQLRLREAELENVRLRRLLHLDYLNRYDALPARVLGRNRIGIHTLVVSVGKSNGVVEHMPVISSDGLVGKILHAGESASTVHLLADRNFRVAARVRRSRAEGIFQWLEGDEGELAGVHHRADVAVGDTIVTSGMSSIFPKGLPVGIASRVEIGQSVLFQQIRVRPTVDFDRLEEVTILRSGWNTLADPFEFRPAGF
ncbi:rod shape-determining protein MreC [candidate division KSB1 bacterium]|nr:rod shape-determining protein MreC [candidate division KSB1 bacterium]